MTAPLQDHCERTAIGPVKADPDPCDVTGRARPEHPGTPAAPAALVSGGTPPRRRQSPEDDMATLTCPGCAAAVSHDDLICFTCGTNLPRRGPVEEEVT